MIPSMLSRSLAVVCALALAICVGPLPAAQAGKKGGNKGKPEQEQNPDQQKEQDQQQSGKSDDKSEKNPSDSKQEGKPEEKKDSGESAFGDMKKHEEPPPPPPENTQQVGGTPEKKENEQKEQMDPALALPMQKLEQLRNQDSPAQLFQLMDGDRKSEKKPGQKSGKNW